ncbi:ribosome biogenesis GTPase Der [Candidatus Pseudomonas adelgestsugas]|uniref:GTPase Der n=1 Tax=Candidatus Pseudomonas adelgestsugas TaxID=1302376 RepID=A0ABX5RA56_9PSED|nr:ribosome biogenesis GTPase Der [Candidatus Pseudomonas adelgestsugas]QAX82252.1 GTPase Der [Candidatus Pseudomonas adelgestsugas]
MVPVIAIVGRPNVGKSTLFNRLTRTRDAIVGNLSGLTRDRHYGSAKWQGRFYIIIDTGGIFGNEHGMDKRMATQSLLAIEEANVVLLLVDAHVGYTVVDQMIGEHLRKHNKCFYLVANKTDNINPEQVCTEFSHMGMGDAIPIAATQGYGITKMLEIALRDFFKSDVEEKKIVVESKEVGCIYNQSKTDLIKIAIIGRPNVGKSTLVNCMLGEDRVIVYEQPGTTRDSIYIQFDRQGERYTLIDTAGVRKRGKIHDEVEKFSVIKTLQAIKDSNVVIFVIDAGEGAVDQDLHLLDFAIEAGRALVIAINKWDSMTLSRRDFVKIELQRRLFFVEFADIHFISALYGAGVSNLYPSIQNSFRSAVTRWPTNYLTRILEDAVDWHMPPTVNKRRIKLRYAHLGGVNPPIIVIHGNQLEKVPKSYMRYLENTYRRVLNLVGTPIRIWFKNSENPYESQYNALADRQVNKKRQGKH